MPNMGSAMILSERRRGDRGRKKQHSAQQFCLGHLVFSISFVSQIRTNSM
jgi:hypothetical protein